MPPDGETYSSASLQCGAQPGPFLSRTVPLPHAIRAQCRGCGAVAGDLEKGWEGRTEADPEYLIKLVSKIVLNIYEVCNTPWKVFT